MKTFTISIAAFLLITVNTYGQWVRYYSLSENLNYSSVSFYQQNTGFATYGSELLKSTDGGLSWFGVNVPWPLDRIIYTEMTDENTVWIVMRQSDLTNYANIYKSEDCGDTWQMMFETNYGIMDLFILDENHMWVGTDYYRVYFSTDGGETWKESHLLQMSTVNDLFFINADTGWASGGDYRDLIEKTTDGGVNWEVQFERYNSQGFGKHIEFINSKKGFCVGRERLMLKTLDAGETWEYVSDDLTMGTPGILHGLPEGYHITDLEFVDENRGWIVGGNGGCPTPPGHFIMSTRDGGDSWQMDMLDEYLPFYGMNQVVFNELGEGWTIGHNGLLFHQEIDMNVPVREVHGNSGLNIFPNPTQSYILINADKEFGTITLYNQFGRMLYRDEAVHPKEMKLDLSQYKSGIYFIEIDGNYYKVVKM